MRTGPTTVADVTSTVMVVPPLARTDDLTVCFEESAKLIRFLEGEGVRSLMYGANAGLHHATAADLHDLLEHLSQETGPDTTVIPSVGPEFGRLMDAIPALAEHDFPSVMVLPTPGHRSPSGVAEGVRRFADALGRGVVLYVKEAGYVKPADVARLIDEGAVWAVKYGIEHEPVEADGYLRSMVEHLDPGRMISGIGEQPAIVHMRDFGMAGYTSGLASLAPRLSGELLAHVRAGRFDEAERIRWRFASLEGWRASTNAVAALHQAVSASAIADMGPLLPLYHADDAPLDEQVLTDIRLLMTSTATPTRTG